MDANLLHTSSEGKALEDPAAEAPDYVYQRTVDPENAPDTPEYLEVSFEKGDAVAINGHEMPPAAILTNLNEIGGRHGVGRLDLVEGRFVGMKVPRHLRDPWRDDPFSKRIAASNRSLSIAALRI